MRRRYASREEWARLLDRHFEVRRVDREGFHGYVTRLSIGSVTEPLIVPLDGTNYRLADAGFTWLQHVPDDSRHTLTTLLDEEGHVIQWYVDIAAATGVDERGIPWWDDLFLDVVIQPNGSIHLLDEDELEEALAAGEVSAQDYELAHAEARRIMESIQQCRFSLLNEAKRDLERCQR
jgi:predicted RNA-binding protein associated with RNAse of E/G family